jgi:hypothetical protein
VAGAIENPREKWAACRRSGMEENPPVYDCDPAGLFPVAIDYGASATAVVSGGEPGSASPKSKPVAAVPVRGVGAATFEAGAGAVPTSVPTGVPAAATVGLVTQGETAAAAALEDPLSCMPHEQ